MQIVFDDMIVDMLSNICWYAELFVRVKKLNFSLVFYKILFCCTEKY